MDELKLQVIAQLNAAYLAAEDFVLDMTLDLAHDYLFLTRHFPVFFILQCIWVCVIVRRFEPRFSWQKSYLTGALMTFLGRVLVAIVLRRASPILDNPLYVPIFTGIWFLMNCFPFDLCHKIVTFPLFLFFFPFAYALVQVRETCHGVDIAFGTLGRGRNNPVSAFIVSALLASTESAVWLLIARVEAREFSYRAILKNSAAAIAYIILTTCPEIIGVEIEIEKEMLKMVILGVYCALAFFDQLVFGMRGNRGFDVTLLTYLARVFKYKGACVPKSK